MTSPRSSLRAKLLGAVVVAIAASALFAAPASASQTVCLGKHGAMHVRNGACRSNERRMPFVRAHGAAAAKTITTCENRKGALRVIKTNGRCKRGEKKLVWNIAGQPQKVTRFSAAQESALEPKPINLFAAGGETYTFQCQFALFFAVSEMKAAGAPATSYGSGVFTRPLNQESLESDAKTQAIVAPIGSTAETIAYLVNFGENKAKSLEAEGVWTVTVQGAKYTTWIHTWLDTVHEGKCKVSGTAITLPN